jgi:hypothetical protein
MAFDDLITRINLFFSEADNEAEDAHQVLEQLHAELAQLKATGQPLPADLVRLEALLDQEFKSRVIKS